MLEAIGLSKQYGAQVALDRLDLSIAPGEVFCLLGANGAGKTTTIHLFLNFIEPTSGTARINGLDVAKAPLETKKYVAYIPEQVMLYPNLTGVENIEYFTALAGREYPRTAFIDLFRQVGLAPGVEDQRVRTYSKGMRQKVGIAIAIAKKAKALLLDEPTSGLDPKASNEFSGLLKRMSSERVAILMATHDLFRAKESGSRVGIMKHGRLVATMNTADMGHADLERLYLEHMHEHYEHQLQRQQLMIDRLSFLSPAVLMQGALNDIAGSGGFRHQHFLAQVDRFHARWRSYIVPLIFQSARITSLDAVPSFTYEEERTADVVRRVLVAAVLLMAPAAGLAAVSFRKLRRYPIVAQP